MQVRLTPEEQAMLRGERGEAKRVALEKIVELAEILGAEDLVPVTKAHLCCGSTASPADFPDGVDPCSIIHDGDLIRVDGETGRVEILEEGGAL